MTKSILVMYEKIDLIKRNIKMEQEIQIDEHLNENEKIQLLEEKSKVLFTLLSDTLEVLESTLLKIK